MCVRAGMCVCVNVCVCACVCVHVCVCACMCVHVKGWSVYPSTKTQFPSALAHALNVREVLRRLFLPGVSAMTSIQQHRIGLHVRSRQIYHYLQSDWPFLLIVP